MYAYEARVIRLPRWAAPLLFIAALGAIGLALVVGLGLLLIAVPVALVAAIVGRLSMRKSREPLTMWRKNSRSQGQSQVIDAEYTVVEDTKR